MNDDQKDGDKSSTDAGQGGTKEKILKSIPMSSEITLPEELVKRKEHEVETTEPAPAGQEGTLQSTTISSEVIPPPPPAEAEQSSVSSDNRKRPGQKTVMKSISMSSEVISPPSPSVQRKQSSVDSDKVDKGRRPAQKTVMKSIPMSTEIPPPGSVELDDGTDPLAAILGDSAPLNLSELQPSKPPPAPTETEPGAKDYTPESSETAEETSIDDILALAESQREDKTGDTAKTSESRDDQDSQKPSSDDAVAEKSKGREESDESGDKPKGNFFQSAQEKLQKSAARQAAIDQIIAAVKPEGFQAPKLSMLYRIALGVLAVTLATSAITYLVLALSASLTSLISALQFYRAIQGSELVQAIVSGAIFILSSTFLVLIIKPLAILREKKMKSIAITRTQEPNLYRFVEAVCEVLDAPVPKHIMVDCDVNAAAGYARGPLSFLTGDVSMTLGLPLLMGMKLNELAMVIAHEIGHLSQGAGKQISFATGWLDMWFSRVVYGKDFLDRLLDSGLDRIQLKPLRLVLQTIRLGFALPRGILWLLMFPSRFFFGFMLRQREFNADDQASALVGSDLVRSTLLHVNVLGHARELTYTGLKRAYDEGKLSDDVPRLIAVNQRLLTPEDRNKIWKGMMAEESTWSSSHPSCSDRIRRAEKNPHPSLFDDDTPAPFLFNDLERFCKEATLNLYEFILGKDYDKELVSSSSLAKDLEESVADIDAQWRFFQYVHSFYRPISISGDDLRRAGNNDKAIEELKGLRKQMEARSANAYACSKNYFEGHSMMKMSKFARRLCEMNLDPLASLILEFEVSSSSLGAYQERGKELMDFSTKTLQKFEELAKNRLLNSLRLLLHSDIADKVKNAAQYREEMRQLLTALNLIARLHHRLMELENDLVMSELQVDLAQKNPFFVQFIQRVHAKLFKRLSSLHDALEEAKYPFNHAAGELTLAEFAVPKMPAPDDCLGTFMSAHGALDRLRDLYFRIIGRIVFMGEQVELALALGPYPEPPAIDEALGDEKSK